MENSPTISMLPQQPPPLPSPSQSVDFAPLEFVLAFIAIIAIPVLIYTFVLSIKCSPSSSNRSSADDAPSRSSGDSREMISVVKYQKEKHVTGECPVCLSAFTEDDDVKQLSACKHAFHTSCIDLWLSSHSNCPVCRATIAVKRPSTTSSGVRDADLQQGLPDATSLV
ncbi:RING-H2 finger protein ATL33-like [Tripterygium wilfordii]|uniref:RING-H2 finger protein ATL33-like n=1 Tax=Tripterygium wilfordii TaxID=458696 RepID=A0A7J7CT64_TRIWF|nr:RING-H2 finger protein ATL33 [Tripterygium wilfordii]KAF5737159.1 RING-H2 finger protein ATL33-like [Tripterygium wilfordii]